MIAKLTAALKELHTFHSTYVMYFLSGLLAYWLQLSPEDQAAVFAVFPALKVVAPFLGLVAFMVARGLPASEEKPNE